MTLLWLGAGLTLLLIGRLWALWLARGFPSLREKDAGTFADHFIYVREDGTARELTPDNRDYLNTNFIQRMGTVPTSRTAIGN
jgi:hypothetical protein